MVESNHIVTKLEKSKRKSGRSFRALQTRARILKAATHLFAQHGFHGVSVDNLVAHARVNKRMVYHYFGSKRGLYGEVLAEVYREIWKVEADVFKDQPDAVGALEELMRRYFEFLQAHPYFVALLLWENLTGGKQLSEIGRGVTKAPLLEALDKVIAQGIQSGELRKGLHRKHLLIHLMGICMMYFSNQHTLSQSMDMDLADTKELEEAISHAVIFAKFGFAGRR